MKKQLRQLLTVACAVVMILSMSVTSFAQAPMTSSQQAPKSDATFEVIFLQGTSTNGSITPFSTWTGDGGVSRLDYMSKNQGFTWSIDVTSISSSPLKFTGEIEVYTQKTEKYIGTIKISGTGNGKTSGTTTGAFDGLNLQAGGDYVAYFSGKAINAKGQSFFVPAGAKIKFTA